MPHWMDTVTGCDAGLEQFRTGLVRLRDGKYEEALGHVRKALGAEPNNPFYLSYAGMLAALVEGRIADGEQLCRQALDLRYNHAQLYLNLAEVYQQGGRKAEAVMTLEKGLVSSGRDYRIRRALERLGLRRAPVLPFLERSHFLNRALGRLRSRLASPKRRRTANALAISRGLHARTSSS